MRLQFGRGQITIDLTGRDGGHDAALNEFVSEFSAGPLVDRAAGLVCRFTGHGQNLRDLLGGEFAEGPAARGVPQNLFDGAAKCGPRLATLDGHQRVERLLPTSPPQTNLLASQPDDATDQPIEHATKCQYDQSRSLHEPLRCRHRADDLLQNCSLPFRKPDFGRLARHDLPPV